MRKIILLTLLLLLSSVYTAISQSVSLDWAGSNYGNSQSEVTSRFCVNAYDESYIVGTYHDTLDFDQGVGVSQHAPVGSSDMYIQKLDSNGSLIWVKSIGGLGAGARGLGVTSDSLGNVYTIGRWDGTVDFDPGPGVSNLSGYSGFFIQKLDSSGTFNWVTSVTGIVTGAGAGNPFPSSISMDVYGNIFITGNFSIIVNFNPNDTNSILDASLTDQNIFVLKIDNNGNFLWVKEIPGVYGYPNNIGNSLVNDLDGNVYVTGVTQGLVDFDPGPDTVYVGLNGSQVVKFVLKLDSVGAFKWATGIYGFSAVVGNAITISNNNELYVTGSFFGTVDFDPDTGTTLLSSTSYNSQYHDLFVEKIDTAGNLIWVKSVGSTLISGTYTIGNAIVTDANSNVFISGYFGGTSIDFNPGPGLDIHNANGQKDVFVQSLDALGNFRWAKTFGGNYDDVGGSIRLDSKSNIYVTGSFSDSVDFNPNAGVYNLNCPTRNQFAIKLNPCNPDTSINVVSTCGSYTWINGTTYTNSSDIILSFENVTGCDSIVMLDLTINQSQSGSDTIIACDTYTWINGVTYGYSNNWDSYTIVGGANNGCDSIVSLDLTINPSYNINDEIWACDSLTWTDGNVYYSSTDTITYSYVNTFGCSSFSTLDLHMSSSSIEIDTVRACDSYTWLNGTTYYASNNSDSVLLTSVSGCDSLIYLDLIVEYSPLRNDSLSVCDSVTWINGVTYYADVDTVKYSRSNAFGCDSIISLDLSVYYSQITDTQIGCDSFMWMDGIIYTASNTVATYTTTNPAGCTSLYNLDLTMSQTDSTIDTVNACIFYSWINGVTYLSNNNTATQTLTNVFGCDSVITLNLTLSNSSMGIDTHIVCDSLTWLDGNTYYSSNTTAIHVVSGGNANGCDSIVTLNLTVSGGIGTHTVSACAGYIWNGVTYTSSNNTATDTLTNASGCDSIVTLNLTVNLAGSSIDYQTTCDSLVWLDGVTYFTSNNIATHTIIAGTAAGCDSIITLDLTVLNPTSSIDVVHACDNYTWIDGIVYITNNTTAVHTITNSIGCDSVVTLNLTINNSSTFTDVITACISYTWIDGIAYTASNSSTSYVLTNSSGCDSTVLLDLTINTVDTSVVRQGLTLTAQSTEATYQWADCNTNTPITNATSALLTITESGSYALEVTQNGCVDTSECFIFTNVSVDQIQVNNGIVIFPNPVHNQFTVEITDWRAVQIALTLLDVNGKLIEIKQLKNVIGKQSVNFDTEHLSRGVYFIKISDGTKSSTTKLVLQ
jgi:hypothetical protein